MSRKGKYDSLFVILTTLEIWIILQLKDMAVKFSGACKPCTGSSSSTSYPPPFPPAAAIRSNSMSASWDFTSTAPHPTSRLDSRFNGQLRSGGGGGLAQGVGVAAVVQEEDHREWVAQVETGVQITFLSLPNGGNDLKRIRFRYFLINLLVFFSGTHMIIVHYVMIIVTVFYLIYCFLR